MAFRREKRYSSDFVAENGTEWDDGGHAGVKNIRIIHNDFGITLVQFDYIDGAGNLVTGLDHGTKPFLYDRVDGTVEDKTGVTNEVSLTEGEYIHTVVAYSGYCVRKIEFVTNRRTIACGVEPHDPENLKRLEARDPDITHELPSTYGNFGKSIVGFHGKSGTLYLHEFGVYFEA